MLSSIFNYKIYYIVFVIFYVLLSFLLLRNESITIIQFVILIAIALTTDKLPGTYQSNSSISTIYRFFRDIFVQLSMIAIVLELNNKSILQPPLIWGVVSICLFFNYMYLQNNKDFIERKGKYFLLSAVTIISSTLLLFFAVFDFFWRANTLSSIIIFFIAIICIAFAIYFNRANRDYLLRNKDLHRPHKEY